MKPVTLSTRSVYIWMCYFAIAGSWLPRKLRLKTLRFVWDKGGSVGVGLGSARATVAMVQWLDVLLFFVDACLFPVC